MRIAICIVTCQRPAGLQRLLGSLQGLELPEGDELIEVVVVDNDRGESAREVCEDARRWLPCPVHYQVEKRRGIPQARNAALATALVRSDAIAFADDDAVVSAGWLAELLRVLRAHRADAVTGPSHVRFEAPAPNWAHQSGLYGAPAIPDGSERSVAFTGNVLIRAEPLSRMAELFDENMALCGGSDCEFFRRFAQAGNRIVWAANAVIHECFPPSRVRVSWILQRAHRVGAAQSYADCKLAPGHSTVAHIVFHGAWCIAKGGALLALSALRGPAAAVRALYLAIYGVGRWSGLLGLRPREYAQVHGR